MYIYDRPNNNVGKKKKKMQIRDLFCSETAGDRNEVCNQTGKKAVSLRSGTYSITGKKDSKIARMILCLGGTCSAQARSHKTSGCFRVALRE